MGTNSSQVSGLIKIPLIMRLDAFVAFNRPLHHTDDLIDTAFINGQ
jgi:hypothetical protein